MFQLRTAKFRKKRETKGGNVPRMIAPYDEALNMKAA